VNLDNDLLTSAGAPRYQFVQSVFNFARGGSTTGSGVSFAAAGGGSASYITARHAVGETAEKGASEGEAGEEGAERDRDGVDLDAHHPAELPHPQRLVDERGGAGSEEQGRDGERLGPVPPRPAIHGGRRVRVPLLPSACSSRHGTASLPAGGQNEEGGGGNPRRLQACRDFGAA